MPQVSKAPEQSESRDDRLAWLVLRVIAELSPCTRAELIARICGDDVSLSESPGRQLVLGALGKLEALDLVAADQEHLAITEDGRRCLDDLPAHAPRPRAKRLVPVPRRLARAGRRRALACAIVLRDWQRRAETALWRVAKSRGLSARLSRAGRRRLGMLAGACMAFALTAAGTVVVLSGERAESSEETAAAEPATQPADTTQPSIAVATADAITAATARTEAIRSAVQDHLAKLAGGPRKDAQAALVAYYRAPQKPLLWVDENGFTDRAKAVMQKIAQADDYGLRAADYDLPRLAASKPNDIVPDNNKPDDNKPHDTVAVDRLADAEIKLGLAVLSYVRDARGGRLKPRQLSANLPTLTLPDPSAVLNAIPDQTDPAAYLRSFHPRARQFEALRQKLLKLRRGDVAENETPDMQIPPGPLLKLGVEDPQVALLRKRLDLLPGRNPNKFDEAVVQAVREFQLEHNVALDGMVGDNTRRLLNAPHLRHGGRLTQIRTVLLNMERWRWLPQDPGRFYVTVNVPEFTLRVVKDNAAIHTARIIVGKHDTQTPIFSDEMETLVFGPYWNVPNSIKLQEIRPYLRQEAWFFGGWNTAILRQHNLRVKYRGREVNPETLDWNRIDIRALHIYQPPGPRNVLGKVKFMFPNKHSVYLHDTLEKNLFAKPFRSESHGCVRVQDPDKLASLILQHDQGWSEAKTRSAMQNGYNQRVGLKAKIPVYITYFTALVRNDGSLSTYRDLYGHDARMAAALFGSSSGFEYRPPPRSARERRISQRPPAPRVQAASDDLVSSITRLLQN